MTRWGLPIAFALVCASRAHAQVDWDGLPEGRWTVVSSNTLSDVDPCPSHDCSYSAVEGQMPHEAERERGDEIGQGADTDPSRHPLLLFRLAFAALLLAGSVSTNERASRSHDFTLRASSAVLTRM